MDPVLSRQVSFVSLDTEVSNCLKCGLKELFLYTLLPMAGSHSLCSLGCLPTAIPLAFTSSQKHSSNSEIEVTNKTILSSADQGRQDPPDTWAASSLWNASCLELALH